MLLGFVGAHTLKELRTFLVPLFLNLCFYYAMQTIMLVCQHNRVSTKRCGMFLVFNLLTKLFQLVG
jgi:hypothetical protein